MIKVYIDLNIFNKLEKLDQLDEADQVDYINLKDLLDKEKIITVYSNAHLNDLHRGYKKNPDFIDGHLNNIMKYTKNLCICQYWGNKEVSLHYRNIHDFFHQKVLDSDDEPESYEGFLQQYEFLQQIADLYKYLPLPPEFKKAYVEPMMGIMFPTAKINNNYYALQSDIYNFQVKLKLDFGLYKAFRSFLITGLNKIKNRNELIKSMNAGFSKLPSHLQLTEILDAYSKDGKTFENALYSKVLETFFKFDLAGYKSDGHFNNMFDDGLHTFYASYFDFFITNDDRCKYKAEKTYEKLKIKTQVLKINELDILKQRKLNS